MTYDRIIMRKELSRDEGRRYQVYRDTVGKQTVGVGRNLDDVGIRPAETRLLGITRASVIANGLTDHQIDVLLDGDIDHAEQGLDAKLPWWRTLDPVRQRVLLNMCFNMGIGDGATGLTSFRNTLELIRTGKYSAAATAMAQSKWHNQVGARALRLESMMKTGRTAS